MLFHIITANDRRDIKLNVKIIFSAYTYLCFDYDEFRKHSWFDSHYLDVFQFQLLYVTLVKSWIIIFETKNISIESLIVSRVLRWSNDPKLNENPGNLSFFFLKHLKGGRDSRIYDGGLSFCLFSSGDLSRRV